MTIKPYWTSPDGAITVYHARCEDVIASVLPVGEVALVHADPPYGQNERTKRAAAKRGLQAGPQGRRKHGSGSFPAPIDWPEVIGDDRPFDPALLLALARPLVTWGAQRYADRLPCSPSWLWWAKKRNPETDQTESDDNGDGEMAWTNLGGPPREWNHVWRGVCRASEGGGRKEHLHPTQKPIALSAYVFSRAKLKRGDLVFVPYLGSGPDLPAAQALGLRVIACDVERWCCDTAIGRLGAITPEKAAEPCGPLFGR